MVYKVFDKTSAGGGVNIPLKFNKELAKELHKPIIRKFHSGFRDNIWGVDLPDIHLISKFNKWFRFLLCVIDFFIKYAWVVPLKDKNGISTVNAFQKNIR